MRSNEEWIQIFGSIRHDWLNVLQLIKGNMALGNEERVMAVIQEAVEQTANESRLCSLGMPKTTLLLLEQKWKPTQHPLDIEVDGELFPLTNYDDLLYACFACFFNNYNKVVDAEESEKTTISFTFFDEKCLIELSYDNDLSESAFHECLADMPPAIKVELLEREGYAITFLLDASQMQE